MAIAINGARFLVRSRARGLIFGRTLCIGHQGLHAPAVLLSRMLQEAGVEQAPGSPLNTAQWSEEWADAFLRTLGIAQLEIMDGSAYEGAGLVHDLNNPIPDSLVESFDTVLDAGCLEHIFDVRVAIENYLRLVKVGGTVILLDMPTTNFSGHGFYQFSPEFFCEVFSKKNGFELVTIVVADEEPYSPFFEVARPRSVGRRVELVHTKGCHLFVVARKVESFNGFAKSIVQSDYEEAWSGRAAEGTGGGRATWADTIRRMWRRMDPMGYWIFSNRRNGRLTRRRRILGLSPDFRRL